MPGTVTAPQEEQLPIFRIEPTARGVRVDFRELWEYRELLYFFVWRDVKVRYKQTVIGAAWAIIQPVMTMVVFSIFFGGLAKIPSDGLPYPIFFYSALLPWNYFAQALTSTTNSMVENQRLITKVYFPRLILPIAAVTTGLVDFAVAFSVLIGLFLWYGIMPSPAVLLLPLLLLLTVVTALGVGLWLAALNALYRDVRFVIPFCIQVWMFASPVVYPSSLVPSEWQWLYGLNPMAGVISGFRWALTGSGQPPNLLLAASAVAMVVILVVGLRYFQRAEETVVDTM
ncbi:MAG: ABC transporter permease [Deltaproteobacteria bacterium]|nr:ABC transporter permease [Deltaproteobacteria bacterium]